MNTNKMAQEIVKNDVFSCLTKMVTEMIVDDGVYLGDFCKYNEEKR